MSDKLMFGLLATIDTGGEYLLTSGILILRELIN